MFNDLDSSLHSWNTSKTDRQKLQHVYLGVAFVAIVIAGLVSLINVSIGRNIALIAVYAVAVFLSNAIIWHLLHSALLLKLGIKPKKKPTL